MAKKVKKAVAAKATQVNSKDALVSANKALTAFLKENKLARDEDHSNHKKLGKEYKALVLAVEKASDTMDDANTKVKATKEKTKSASKGRATLYTYPEGLTPAEKKDFRVKARREKKAAEKGTAAPKAKTAKEDKAKGGKKEVETVVTKKAKTGKKKAGKKSSKND